MWPTAVVVGAVPGEDRPQVPLNKDQDSVGELGSGGPDEAFGEAVARGQRGGIFTVAIPAPVRTLSNAVVNWPARSRTRNRKVVARSSRSISRFLACWVVHAPVGWLVVPRMDVAVADFQSEEHVDPFQGDSAVDVEEVHGQHAGGLCAQEPAPGRVGRSQRRRWCPP